MPLWRGLSQIPVHVSKTVASDVATLMVNLTISSSYSYKILIKNVTQTMDLKYVCVRMCFTQHYRDNGEVCSELVSKYMLK